MGKVEKNGSEATRDRSKKTFELVVQQPLKDGRNVQGVRCADYFVAEVLRKCAGDADRVRCRVGWPEG